MKYIPVIVRVIRDVVCSVLLAYLLFMAHATKVAAPVQIQKIDSAITQVGDFASAQKVPVQKLIAQWTAPAVIANQMLATERNNQQAQLDSVNQFTKQGLALVATANVTMGKAGEAIDSLKTIAPAITSQINQIGSDIHITLTATTELVNAMTSDLNDPDIKLSLSQIAQLTAALRDTAIKGDAIALDVKKVADHYEIQIDTPATKGQKFIAGARITARILGDFIKF